MKRKPYELGQNPTLTERDRFNLNLFDYESRKLQSLLVNVQACMLLKGIANTPVS